MADSIARARTVIEARLRELNREIDQLEVALRGLRTGARSPGTPKRRGRSNGQRRGPSRAPRGQRRQQLIDALGKKPGATVAELAKEIGITPNQAHGLVRALRSERIVRKSGRGLRISAKAPK